MSTGLELPAVTLRPARLDDARIAAELIILSMRGEADVFFGHEKQLPALEVAGRMFQCAGGRFSYLWATTADVEHHPAGLLLAYPGCHLPGLDRATGRYFLKLFGIGAVVRLIMRMLPYSLQEAEPDEFYISNVAVLPSFQGRKIGTSLLVRAEELAQRHGFEKCALMVESENENARRLYERAGYQVVSTKWPPFTGGIGFHRMVKHLAGSTASLKSA